MRRTPPPGGRPLIFEKMGAKMTTPEIGLGSLVYEDSDEGPDTHSNEAANPIQLLVVPVKVAQDDSENQYAQKFLGADACLPVGSNINIQGPKDQLNEEVLDDNVAK